MFRLEILDQKDEVLSVHALQGDGLTLVGRAPSAHVHVAGKGIGALHAAIKPGKNPVIMDLGGPTPLRVNGKETIEQVLDLSDARSSAIVEIGSRRMRITRAGTGLVDVRTTPWAPVRDRRERSKAKTALTARIRLYVKGIAEEARNTRSAFRMSERYGLARAKKIIWLKGKDAFAELPPEWLAMGGRIQIGKDKIEKLDAWASACKLERDTVYRVFAGPYLLEILIAEGEFVIGAPSANPFPAELRKPFGVATMLVAATFATWMLLFGKPTTKVEEPYPVYARIQNIPVEKLPEPEQQQPQDHLQNAGGGAGSEAKETTAQTKGAAPSAQSQLAKALTGGLSNLVGNVLSQAKTTDAVMAESGVGHAAATGSPGPAVGKLATVGSGANAVAGAAKLGNLGLAGSGKGFSGGSGMGLGQGAGTGIGNGVGQGIGRGNFKILEEESIVDGGLDKSVINAVIQNNLSQIKYCYERQLVAEPDLFGKVVASWVITAQGLVENAAVKQTTLNSNPVEQCMLAKISGWKFPQPKNGTKVHVSYPFLFKSTK